MYVDQKNKIVILCANYASLLFIQVNCNGLMATIMYWFRYVLSLVSLLLCNFWWQNEWDFFVIWNAHFVHLSIFSRNVFSLSAFSTLDRFVQRVHCALAHFGDRDLSVYIYFDRLAAQSMDGHDLWIDRMLNLESILRIKMIIRRK